MPCLINLHGIVVFKDYSFRLTFYSIAENYIIRIFNASLFFNCKPLKTVSILFLSIYFASAYAGERADIQLMIKQLRDKSERQVLLSAVVDTAFEHMDSAAAYKTFARLQQAADDDAYLQVRLMLLNAELDLQHRRLNPLFRLFDVDALFNRSLKKAMEINDELLVAEVCRKYALFCDWFPQLEKAMFYSLKSLDIQEKYGIDKFPDPLDFYFINADILYKVGEYELCNLQLNKVLKLRKTHAARFLLYRVYNTTGLACAKLNKFDSAFYWYRAALPLTIQNKDTAWQGIVTGNIGDVFLRKMKYDSAKYYLLKEYDITKNSTVEKKSAHNSLLKVARILALQGKADSALLLIKNAEPVLFEDPREDNRNLYRAKAEVYKALHKNDSATLYFGLFQHQDDSINAKLLHCRADVTLVKLDYEKSQQVIMQMVAEKQREKEKQLILWTGIVIALVIGYVIYRQRLQQIRLEKELLLQQKLTAEQTFAAAREQLKLFTIHIIEKNEMIDRLQRQLYQQNQTIHEELLSQTILTDEDWMRFKLLFEKVYTGFFETLQNKAPGITPAELRLAALLQLKLDTKNIAAMQGISADAVRKSKSRLRQRLNITLEDVLEEYISAIAFKS